MSDRGLILFAHGARDPRWAVPFEAMAQHIRSRQPGRPVTLAFLEFMTPDLEQAAGTLVQAGCRQIDLVPMFLGSGGHVRKDLPAKLDALQLQHAGTSFTLHPAIGEVDSVLRAMAEAALALAGAAA